MMTTEDEKKKTNYEARIPLFGAFSWMVVNTLTAENTNNNISMQ